MKTVLVTGASGLLGSTLVPMLQLNGYAVKTHAHNCDANYQADLSDSDGAFKLLTQVAPDAIVNLVGLTDVDLCEAQPNLAYMANVKTVENISAWINKTKAPCHLVQISTDQVYDGTGPHLEEFATLTNYYSFSKYAGELAASAASSTILRTNFFGRSRCDKRKSLTDWLVNSLSNDNNIQVFDDVLFSPLSMATLSEMINIVLRNKAVGVFNLGSHNGMSKADFAFSLAEELGLPTAKMTRTKSDKVTFIKTYRPKDMRMDSRKFEEVFQMRMNNLVDEIKLAAKDYHA
jgi:dTDP-4-dehydrorhamnose reductase